MVERTRRPRVLDPLAERSSGILLHPSSLPGPYGMGDLGRQAHRFLEFLAKAGQRWWQMLPVGPVGAGYSPYASSSSRAGNPLLVDLDDLFELGLLERGELRAPAKLRASGRARYREAASFREHRLRQAYARFAGVGPSQARSLEAFRERNRSWLDDWTLFRALGRAQLNKPWTEWDAELRKREPAALAIARARLRNEIGFHEFVQWAFDRQWRALKAHSVLLGVRLLGDMPMYVAHDGVETWSRPELFHLGPTGRPSYVAGVPPDAFSRTGQLWGNPLYRWDVHEKTQFAFWVDRLGGALERFDAVRLDHFIGFHRSWQVRAGARTAIRGRFVENPGDALFDRLEHMLGGLPFIAEDLGIVTEAVHGLRERWQLSGMRVLQFGFGDGATLHLPHRYPRRALVCTGTHDTPTIVGWYRALSPADRRRVAAYAGVDPRRPHRAFMRLVVGSVAQLAILPLQDALGLGDAARMNRPGTPRGNWEWRVTGRELSDELASELAAMVRLYERTPL